VGGALMSIDWSHGIAFTTNFVITRWSRHAHRVPR
jgi:hypothetical protein